MRVGSAIPVCMSSEVRREVEASSGRGEQGSVQCRTREYLTLMMLIAVRVGCDATTALISINDLRPGEMLIVRV